MNTLAWISTLTVLLLFILYKWNGFRLYKKLKKCADAQLADLDFFKEVLGNSYEYKYSHRGYTRCRWVSFFYTVKASFNDDNMLRSAEIDDFKFFSLKNKISFY